MYGTRAAAGRSYHGKLWTVRHQWPSVWGAPGADWDAALLWPSSEAAEGQLLTLQEITQDWPVTTGPGVFLWNCFLSCMGVEGTVTISFKGWAVLCHRRSKSAMARTQEWKAGDKVKPLLWRDHENLLESASFWGMPGIVLNQENKIWQNAAKNLVKDPRLSHKFYACINSAQHSCENPGGQIWFHSCLNVLYMHGNY